MKGVSVQLFDETGAAYASGTNIAVMWFDSELPPDLGMIKGQSAIATTDASGYLSLDLDDVTGLNVGDFGFLVCYKLDGGDHRASPAFVSKMEVTSMTGVTKLGPLTDYVRNPDWPAQVAMVDGVQKFTGLLAVFDHDSNFIALEASGNYTVNWGDGGGDFNVNASVQAERNISYASVGGTIVGTSKAVAVTFTDTGDTVNRTAHGYQNGQRVNFASIVSTTGISTHTTYFVVGRTANTFQVASTLGGSALPLTTDGSGTVYIPEYKVALVTVTPQAGQNLTAFSLQKVHSQSGLNAYAPSAWLSLRINGASLASLEVANSSGFCPANNIVEFALGENVVTSFHRLLRNCYALRQVSEMRTASGTNFSGVFSYCASLQAVPFLDMSGGTNVNEAFNNCSSLQAVPLIDVSSATTASFLFNSCYALQAIPALDLSLCTSLTSAFSYCWRLTVVGSLNTPICAAFDSAFRNCSSLVKAPWMDTGAATNLSVLFSFCTALQEVPCYNTSAATNVFQMFNSCSSLRTVPLLDISNATLVSLMFYQCGSLQILPPLNFNSATVIGNFVFGQCYNLAVARLVNAKVDHGFVDCKLSSAALDDIYTGLPTVTAKTITVTGNYGTTGDTPSIATGKGWTVTG